MNIREIALQTISIEALTIQRLSSAIDDTYEAAVNAIYNSTGRVVVTGIGKSAIIGQKIVATMNSTGTPSIFMHAADAVHGDLGMIREDDIVLCISKSGESPEIKVLLPFVKSYSNKVIAIVSNSTSYLATHADHSIVIPIEEEADPNNLAPTASTTAQMVIGDALAVSLLSMRGFTQQHFAKFHPGGSLGKQLYTKVSDLMSVNDLPQVALNDSIRTIIVSISSGMKGVTAVISDHGLAGIITDGDLRRMLEKEEDVSKYYAKDIMNTSPKTIEANMLAVDALQIMRESSISQLLVLVDGEYTWILHLHDLIKEGII